MAKQFVATVGNVEKQVSVEQLEDGRWKVTIDGVERTLEARRAEGSTWTLVHDGRVVNVEIEPGKQGDLDVEVRGTRAGVKLVDPRTKKLEAAKAAAATARGTSGPVDLAAPMPGKVVKVLVKVGDKVTAGQGVAVIEAMKMENELKSTRDGQVAKIHVSEGQNVEGQAPVITIE